MIPPFPEKKCRLITACHSFFLLLCSFFFQPTWNEKNRRTEVMSFRNHELDNAIIHSKVRTVCKRNLRKGGYIKETSKKNSRKTHHVKKLRRLRRITVRWWNRERKIGRRKKNGAKMGGRSLVIQVCARKNVWILSVSKIQRERERERAFVEKKKAKRGIFRWWSPPALVVTKYRVSRPKEDQVLLLGEAQSGVHLLGPPPKSDTDPQKKKKKKKKKKRNGGPRRQRAEHRPRSAAAGGRRLCPRRFPNEEEDEEDEEEVRAKKKDKLNNNNESVIENAVRILSRILPIAGGLILDYLYLEILV